MYVTVRQGEGADIERSQAIVNYETKTVAPKTAQELLGGEVIGGDDGWVLVEKTNPDAPWGLFRMRPDGSEEQAVMGEKSASAFDQAHSTWVIETLGGLDDDRFYYSTYSTADGLEEIGCINGEELSTHIEGSATSHSHAPVLTPTP